MCCVAHFNSLTVKWIDYCASFDFEEKLIQICFRILSNAKSTWRNVRIHYFSNCLKLIKMMTHTLGFYRVIVVLLLLAKMFSRLPHVSSIPIPITRSRQVRHYAITFQRTSIIRGQSARGSEACVPFDDPAVVVPRASELFSISRTHTCRLPDEPGRALKDQKQLRFFCTAG